MSCSDGLKLLRAVFGEFKHFRTIEAQYNTQNIGKNTGENEKKWKTDEKLDRKQRYESEIPKNNKKYIENPYPAYHKLLLSFQF